jgi:quinol monooxygenase YgiN
MTIHRIGEFQAQTDKVEELRAFLQSIMPIILGSEGCEGCALFQSRDDPTRFTMTETWRDIEAHQASVKNIPPNLLRAIQPLLAAPPRGGYYNAIT